MSQGGLLGCIHFLVTFFFHPLIQEARSLTPFQGRLSEVGMDQNGLRLGSVEE